MIGIVSIYLFFFLFLLEIALNMWVCELISNFFERRKNYEQPSMRNKFQCVFELIFCSFSLSLSKSDLANNFSIFRQCFYVYIFVCMCVREHEKAKQTLTMRARMMKVSTHCEITSINNHWFFSKSNNSKRDEINEER